MSAWVVSKHHINLLVSAAIERAVSIRLAPACEIMPASADAAQAIGLMLFTENVRSVVHRYGITGATEEAGYRQELAEYRFRFYPGIRPSAVAQALACYDYQACECDDDRETPAAFLVAQLENAVGEPSGSDAEPWGFDSEETVIEAMATPRVVA
jgi:hypothetical protein